MEILITIAQLVIGVGLLNVWLIRAGKSTNYRGGAATTLAEEFAVYGLPKWSYPIVGVAKVTLAVLLLIGIWYSPVTRPASLLISLLMLAAVCMHAKVRDPITKVVPASTLLCLSLLVALLG
jgi:hypothetical protein